MAKTKFLSKCSNQVLTIKPQRPQIIDGIVIPVPGEHIRFENGEYETDDKVQLAFLRGHRLYGVAIFEEKARSGQVEAAV